MGRKSCHLFDGYAFTRCDRTLDSVRLLCSHETIFSGYGLLVKAGDKDARISLSIQN